MKESYVAALIEEFKQGHLPLKEGMSLRCFLAKMVYCNPKRISKKVSYRIHLVWYSRSCPHLIMLTKYLS